MGLVVTTFAGLSIWIVLWATGIKAFDAFLITLLMVLVAATARIVSPFLPGNRE
jgi:Mn2+/Fe2+ NRAMP family transporter